MTCELALMGTHNDCRYIRRRLAPERRLTGMFALHLGERYVCFGEYVAQVVAVHRNQHGVIWIRGVSRERYDVRAISVIGDAWRRDLNPFFGRKRAVLFVVNREVLR